MSKLTLSDVTNLQSEATAVSRINANSDAIEQALENTLSRDGTSPNTMEADLDMNSNSILNLPEPRSTTEPVRKAELDALIIGELPSYVALDRATQAEAEAGTDNTKYMTPLRTKQAIAGASNMTFETKADAEAYTGPTPEFIEIVGNNTASDVGGGLYQNTGSVPAHDQQVTIGSTTYTRVPAAPRTRASITELVAQSTSVDDTTHDATPGWNKVLEAAANSGFKHWYAPPGLYIFHTAPDDINTAFSLVGDGQQQSMFYKNFESSGTKDAIINIRAQAVDIKDIGLVGLMGSQNPSNQGTGSLISLVAATDLPLGYNHLENLLLTSAAPSGQATCYAPLFIDGSARLAEPEGVRAPIVKDCKVFGGENASIWMRNVVAPTIIGGGTYTAGGVTGRIILDAGGGNYNHYVYIDMPVIFDGVVVSYTQGAVISAGYWGGGNIFNGGNNTNVRTIGPIDASVTFSNMDTNMFHMGHQAGVLPIDSGSNSNGSWIKYSDGTIQQRLVRASLSSGTPTALSYPISFPTQTDTMSIAVEGSGSTICNVVSTATNQITVEANGNFGVYVVVWGH